MDNDCSSSNSRPRLRDTANVDIQAVDANEKALTCETGNHFAYSGNPALRKPSMKWSMSAAFFQR